ncbi:hypothetical protein RFI_09542 [Reticulomyxa filosa]|uniref:Uncharacterized protein n=1 Tax=Reticulomyxa filosa TaxID=46433 RepID=X6NPG6_RETFI|nr:hypothetical protein RFI_09542 [Reticulomyxa filosa]|eukprot:ETO27589.1 hypothetical protein RFI_09542 [Reticulomyxa filosa]
MQELVVGQITGYVIEQFSLAQKQEEEMCEKILVGVGKTSNFRFLADNLGSKVHRYDDECPLTPLEFLNWKKDLPKDIDVLTPHKKSAFRLTYRIIRQHAQSFEKYIPILLQVWFCYCYLYLVLQKRKNVVDCVIYVYMCLFTHGENDLVRKLGARFGIETHQASHTRRQGSLENLNLKSGNTLSLPGIDIWRKAKPEWCSMWSDVAMSWALQSSKDDITIKAPKKLSFCGVRNGVEHFGVLCDEKQEWNKMEYRIAFALAYILLTLPHGLVHKSSLNFLNKFMQLKCKYSTDQVIQDMRSTFQFEFSTVGEGIAEMLKNSLVREDLFDVYRLNIILAPDLNPHENDMFHLTVLAHFIKIQLRALAQFSILPYIYVRVDLSDSFFFLELLFFQKKKLDCRHLVTILECYEDKCRPMIRCCQIAAQYTNSDDFFVALFQEYFRVFGSEDRFNRVTQTLCKFLEYGSRQWHGGVLRLIDIVISNSSHGISSELFKEVADILITTSFLAESNDLVNLISEVGYRLVQKTSRIFPEKTIVFQFTQPTESLRRMQHTRAHNKHRFASRGIDEEQELQDLCVQRMKKHLFPYLDDAVRQQKAPKHLRSHSSLDLAPITFNVSITSPRTTANGRTFPTTVLVKSGTTY